MKAGETDIATKHSDVSMLFADIVNFMINIYRGRHLDAGMSFLGLFSYIGLFAPFAKLGSRYYYRPTDQDEDDESANEKLVDDNQHQGDDE